MSSMDLKRPEDDRRDGQEATPDPQKVVQGFMSIIVSLMLQEKEPLCLGAAASEGMRAATLLYLHAPAVWDAVARWYEDDGADHPAAKEEAVARSWLALARRLADGEMKDHPHWSRVTQLAVAEVAGMIEVKSASEERPS